MNARLMVLDCASMYFRAFYGVPATVHAPDGSPVNAVRGFLDATARLIAGLGPDRLIAAWDNDWRPAFRVAAIASYKAHRVEASAVAQTGRSGVAAGSAESAPPACVPRESVPPELGPQIDVIIAALSLLGIARCGVDGYEADDVIGTVATRARGPVQIVTGDRDLFQLIDDSRDVAVLYTAGGGGGGPQLITATKLRAKYGVGPDQYADFALLRGDPSDGLPGVAGIGEKTAAALIRDFGDIEGILAAAHSVTVGRTVPVPPLTRRNSANLMAAADYMERANTVVRVVTDLPISDALIVGTAADLPPAPPDALALAEFSRRWGIQSSVGRLAAALRWR